MAIPAGAVWEARATATAGNVNGGFFNSARGGTDYTLQNTAQLTLTDLTTSGAGATTVTSATGGFTSAMVGNGIYIASGTNFTVGWYEIVTYTNTNNVVLDRTPTAAAAGSAGTGRVGGALSLGSSLDDDVFEAMVAGNVTWIKAGTYTMGEGLAIASVSATGTSPIFVYGYNSTRGDNPTTESGNQPILAFGANGIASAQYWIWKYFTVTSTAAVAFSTAIGVSVEQVKVLNSSTTTTRVGLQIGQRAFALSCECVSQNGVALATSSTSQYILGCYAHDSSTGISVTSNGSFVGNCVVNSCSSVALNLGASTVGNNTVANMTLRGSAAKVGTGITITGADSPADRIANTTISGFTTGISKTTTEQKSILDFNCNYYDNTADTALFTKSNTAIAVDPQFVDVTELTGTTATTAGSVLTDSGADFSSVEDNVDYLRVTSGTGVTVGIYLITAHTSTTLTVNNALGTSSAGNVVYTVPTGHNLAIGTNLKGLSTPLKYGQYTTNALDIGAVQRVEPSAGGSTYTFGG